MARPRRNPSSPNDVKKGLSACLCFLYTQSTDSATAIENTDWFTTPTSRLDLSKPSHQWQLLPKPTATWSEQVPQDNHLRDASRCAIWR